MKQDMINGSPSRSLIAFSIPVILGQLFQNLYIIIDLLIVGRMLGQNSLAAVGSTSTICLIYVNVAIGFALGCSVVISQLFGAEQYLKLKNAVNTSTVIIILMGIASLLIGYGIGDWILHATNTPDVLMGDARAYYFIYVLGFPGMYLYNIANATFNALGKSKLPLLFLACSSVLNIGLDLLFIGPLQMGVAGAAWATTISQYLAAIVSCICAFRYIAKNFRLEEKPLFFDTSLVGKIFKIAIPSCIQQSIMSFGYMFMQSLVNTFSADVIAGYSAAIKVDSIAIIPLGQVANSLANFTGQNIGAGKIERVSLGLKTALIMDAVISAVVAAILIPLARPILVLFMNGDINSAAVGHGATIIIISSSFYFIMGLLSAFAAVLRGAGDANWSMFSLLANFTIRVIIANILVAATGSELGIWWAPIIGWTTGAIITIGRYLTGKWKSKAVFSKTG